jgi:hypothetical protein
LTTIALENNGIGDEGASAFADALAVNTSVTSLNLGNTSEGPCPNEIAVSVYE